MCNVALHIVLHNSFTGTYIQVSTWLRLSHAHYLKESLTRRNKTAKFAATSTCGPVNPSASIGANDRGTIYPLASIGVNDRGTVGLTSQGKLCK